MKHRRRFSSALVLTGALLALTAGPAAADPPGPTNYRTEIIGLDPEVDGIEADVLGGDAFLQLRVTGHEVVVPGYDGEELYLRYDADGSVYENVRSRAWFQNQARYGALERDIPSDTGASVPPEWVLVSTDGTFAWHDHRIHFMSPTSLPPVGSEDGVVAYVDPNGGEQLTTVFAEPIMIRVDGEPVGLVGDLYYVPDASPLLAVLAAVLGLVVVVGLGLRRVRTGVLAGVLGSGVVALGVGLPQVVGLPTGVTGQTLQVVLPAIALVVGLAGLALKDRPTVAVGVTAAGAVPLLVWVVVNAGAFTAPIIPPTDWPADLVRAVYGAVVGAALGALGLAARLVLTDPGASDAVASEATPA